MVANECHNNAIRRSPVVSHELLEVGCLPGLRYDGIGLQFGVDTFLPPSLFHRLSLRCNRLSLKDVSQLEIVADKYLATFTIVAASIHR